MSSQRIGVGVCILPERPWREASELWRQAEDLGFDHAWTYDHLTWGGLPNSPWYAAFPTLAPTYPFSGVDRFEDALGRALECGFTDAVCTWPRPTNPYAGSMSTVQEVASRLF